MWQAVGLQETLLIQHISVTGRSDQMLVAVKEMEWCRVIFQMSEVEARPHLRGNPSKVEQTAISKEVFQNTKANEKKPIMQQPCLSPHDFCCVFHINSISSVP